MRKWIPALLIIAATIASAVVYPQLPERIPTHWDMSGNVNGWSSRLVGAWLLPVVMAFVWLILRAVPHIDPRRANYEKFAGIYETMIVVTLAFMLGLHVMLLMAATGTRVDITRVTVISVGVLFTIIGFMLPKVHPNWFIGIRTPWTLTSDLSWEKTHRLGGPLFTVIGVLTVVTALVASKVALVTLIVSAIVAVVILFIYSYRVWKEDTNCGSTI